MKYLACLLIFCLAFTPEYSIGSSQVDSAGITENTLEIQANKFDQSILSDLRSDANFTYDQPPNSRPNFLQMLFNKFFEWLVFVFGNEAFAWLVLIILIAVGIVGLGFAVYGIFGIGKTVPIYGSDSEALEYSLKDEDIHEMDFLPEIDIAVEQKDYKRAIRLVYLFALKLMSDHTIIEWLPSKTNHDYLYEIRSEKFQQNFSKLSYFFEYVWYGDFHPSISHYKEMREAFAALKENIKLHERD